MSNQDQFQSITAGLDNVHGGGKAKLAWEATKKGGEFVRKQIKSGADLATDLLKLGAGTVGGIEAARYVKKQIEPEKPATQPTQPATDTE